MNLPKFSGVPFVYKENIVSGKISLDFSIQSTILLSIKLHCFQKMKVLPYN